MNEMGWREPFVARAMAQQEEFDPSRGLDIALSELAAIHDELRRLALAHKALTDDVERARSSPMERRQSLKVMKAERLTRLRSRRIRGELSSLLYYRRLVWILVRSGRLDAANMRPKIFDETYQIPKPELKYFGFSPIRHSSEQNKFDQSVLWIRVLERRHSSDRKFLELARKVHVKSGSITSVLEYTHKLAPLLGVKGESGIATVQGRIKEISGWIPRVPGPRVQISPTSSAVIMHLVKESRPHLSNGFTSRSHENFKAERDAGLTPVVVTELGFPDSGVETAEPDVEVIDGIDHHRLHLGLSPYNGPVERWLEDFAYLAYKKMLEVRPAVLHVSSGRRGYETALVALALKRKTGVPLVYEVRSFFEGTWTGDISLELSSEIFRRRSLVEMMCMQMADQVVTICESMKAEIVSRGIPDEKVTIIPNGVDVNKFSPDRLTAELRDQFRISLPTFGYVSNMDHARESQETLIRTLAILDNRGVHMQCVLVGGGPRIEILRELASTLGVDGKVIFCGPVDHSEVPAHYGLIDIFVVPRIDERASRYVTPLKPLEAMSMGLVVVASDLPALRELVDPPSRGVVFEPGNAEALADTLVSLLHDPEYCKNLAENGRAWVQSERQWSLNGARYLSVFEKARAATMNGDECS